MQKGQSALEMIRREELIATMSRSMHDVEVDIEPTRRIRTLEFVRLIDRHLRILIAVKKQQRGIGPVDMEYRAGELCEFPSTVGQCAKE